MGGIPLSIDQGENEGSTVVSLEVAACCGKGRVVCLFQKGRIKLILDYSRLVRLLTQISELDEMRNASPMSSIAN